MTNRSSEIEKLEKLVQDIPTIRLDIPVPDAPRTKKRAYKGRNKVGAHIEPIKRGSGTYYRYRRGTDKPIYLGSADSILRAVTGKTQGKRPANITALEK